MSEAKYTLAPWRSEECYFERPVHGRVTKSINRVIMGDDGMVIATVWAHSMPIERAMANAQLMAAAPDLLAACQALLIAADQGERSFWHAAGMARAAIAKANQ